MTSNDMTISYFIDSEDRIYKVTGPWDEFALDNNGPNACVKSVIGKPLTSFITGEAAQKLTNTMLTSARELKQTISRPYRCDSGWLKRYMEMSVVPHEDGTLEVHHRILRTEPLSKDKFVPTQWTSTIGVEHTKRCSICNKVNLNQEWFEIDEAIRLDLLPLEQSEGPWDFGVCPSCLV